MHYMTKVKVEKRPGQNRRMILNMKKDDMNDSSIDSGIASVIVVGEHASKLVDKRSSDTYLLPKYALPRTTSNLTSNK